MIARNHWLAMAAAGAALAHPGTASASDRTYRVDANASTNIELSVCSTQVYMVANGDDDTDLDFWLYDDNGNLIHSDTDTTDITFFTIQNSRAGANGQCLTYNLQVSNLGNVYNNMNVALTDQGTAGTTGGGTNVQKGGGAQVQKGGGGGGGGGGGSQGNNISVRIDANGERDVNLNLCSPSVYLQARGDGDTDLDFWVYDERGNQVHSDTDSTDLTFATLRNGRSSGNCVDWRLHVRNFGNVYNQLSVTLTDQ